MEQRAASVSRPRSGPFFLGTEDVCSRLGQRHNLRAMFTRYQASDFSVVIKARREPPNPWRWEIYCAGRSSAVEQSSEYFTTMNAANKAGKEALAKDFA